MPVTLLGIRHHGPGSCRHVVEYLNELKPDLILLEAPSDVAPMLDFVPSLSQAKASPLPLPEPEKSQDEAKAQAIAHAMSTSGHAPKKSSAKKTAAKKAAAEDSAPVLPDLLRPPVALMAYQNDSPSNAAFYPFAEFSPELQTMLYGKEHGVEVRPFDLPLSYTLAQSALKQAQRAKEASAADLEAAETEAAKQAGATELKEQDPKSEPTDQAAEPKAENPESKAEGEGEAEAAAAEAAEVTPVSVDPFDYLAQVEGLKDGEQWWETRIEQRLESSEIFKAVELAVTALRQALPEHSSARDLVREAWMRKELRAAIKDAAARAQARTESASASASAGEGAAEGAAEGEVSGPKKGKVEGHVVVVCGAWHVPALADLARYKVKDDNALIKEQPKPLGKGKIGVTWIPWTYSRLSYYSGYGAGINAPGWYHHVFLHPDDDGTLWLSQVAAVLRREGHDISVAHVMEAVRLARTLAALRGLSHPALAEFNEAVTTVMGMGDDLVLRSVASTLVIADRIGTIPSTVPMVPLLADITALQKRLRQPFTEGIKTVDLDLRKPLDLERSVLFHRLSLMGIAWAQEVESSSRGTFRESWELNYRPEQMVQIIEHAIYGNTLLEAVQNYVQTQMREHPDLEFITKTLERVMNCDLPDLVEVMSARLNDLAAQASDLHVLLRTVPPLCSIVRYGNVRKFDFSSVRTMLETMITRINVGGLLICCNINDDAARTLKDTLGQVNLALNTLNDESCLKIWCDYIAKIQSSAKVHPLLSGCATRLMRDQQTVTNELILQALSYYSSVGNSPSDIAFWFEGFLEGSGTVLLLDDVLWGLVNSFICNLDQASFDQILPIMRRTFSTFEQHERTQLGHKAKAYDPEKAATQGTSVGANLAQLSAGNLPDDKLARPVIELVCSFLGIELTPDTTNHTA